MLKKNKKKKSYLPSMKSFNKGLLIKVWSTMFPLSKIPAEEKENSLGGKEKWERENLLNTGPVFWKRMHKNNLKWVGLHCLCVNIEGTTKGKSAKSFLQIDIMFWKKFGFDLCAWHSFVSEMKYFGCFLQGTAQKSPVLVLFLLFHIYASLLSFQCLLSNLW